MKNEMMYINKKRLLSDKQKAILIKWWSIAAVYFFVGWGTPLGNQSLIDFVVFLSFFITVANVFFIEPVIKLMLHLEDDEKVFEKNIGKRLIARLISFIKTLLIVTIMFCTYELINTAVIYLLNLSPTLVPIPGEPISFSVFYLIIEKTLMKAVRNIRHKVLHHS